MKSLEILASLSSLYPLQPFEQKAVKSIVDMLTVKPTTRREEGYGDRAEYINYCPTCDRDLSYYAISDDDPDSDSSDRYFKLRLSPEGIVTSTKRPKA